MTARLMAADVIVTAQGAVKRRSIARTVLGFVTWQTGDGGWAASRGLWMGPVQNRRKDAVQDLLDVVNEELS